MASVIRLEFWSKAINVTRTSLSCPGRGFHVVLIPRKQETKCRIPGNQRRRLHVESAAAPASGMPTHSQLLELPRSCPGCGAFTQVVSPEQPGFYTTNRRSVKAFIASHERVHKGVLDEPNAFKQVLDNVDAPVLSQLGLEGVRIHGNAKGSSLETSSEGSTTPVCNRCHDLIHHHIGTPIIHPTVQSIQDIISESPYKYNHVYHVLDAADFPLSLIPSLQRHLSLAPQRSLNRRAKTSRFQYGRKAEISFIITRSDLLAPKREQVDCLMPYILQVLRGALAGSGENVRLGNVRCVSSKRGWWTKQVKEDIWNRGGGGWMVGKVNVGKSKLFENVFPKGRNECISFDALRHAAQQSRQDKSAEDSIRVSAAGSNALRSEQSNSELSQGQDAQLLGDSLLPPAPVETPYPVLPLVSSLPGTTASPIRVPFGGGRGELIDLPGLSRGDLDQHVINEHKLDLVMQHRVKPIQVTIKPGQSLLVGGLVRITPITPGLTFLAYPFVPLQSHVTHTERAIAIHTQKETSGVASIAKPGIGSRMDPAGSYPLKWDVTKQRAGPLTEKSAVGLSPGALPFVVLSTDVLIEGCGWIELVAQVRKKDMETATQPGDLFDATPFPRVEVFSPDGKHIGVRQPMGAWLLNGEKPGSASRYSARPRRSMKGVKKELKKARREHM